VNPIDAEIQLIYSEVEARVDGQLLSRFKLTFEDSEFVVSVSGIAFRRDKIFISISLALA
jgi:hypothetical protein